MRTVDISYTNLVWNNNSVPIVNIVKDRLKES